MYSNPPTYINQPPISLSNKTKRSYQWLSAVLQPLANLGLRVCHHLIVNNMFTVQVPGKAIALALSLLLSNRLFELVSAFASLRVE
jgi:hypothetical protein